MIERSNSITTSSRWLRPRVRTVTIPKPGRDRDSRFASTSVSARIVSPAKTGAGSVTSRQPRLTPCSDTASTDSPVTSASVKVESTSGRFHSVAAAYSASKWIGFVFIVRSVNQTLSASSTVRPCRERYVSPTCIAAYDRAMASIIASRPWRGYADLPALQELAVEQRRLLGPRAPWHVGDVAWGLRQHEGREHEWTIRLWEEEGRVVAWSWLKGAKGWLEWDVRRDRLHLLEEILDEPRAEIAVCHDDDEPVRAALAERGFVEPRWAIHLNLRDLEEPPAQAPLPDGFRCRTVEPGDLAERVAIHREVWAPSRVTESSFANVRATWPYRGSLDCVCEAPGGRFAAYVLAWPDDENRVGLFEPVGTREEFRRRGLGAAVCTFALRRLHEEGLRQAIVGCASGPACALYESLGFRRGSSLVGYAR
jgi:ribosomal protein S18 acetylase RimI-like enzyme